MAKSLSAARFFAAKRAAILASAMAVLSGVAGQLLPGARLDSTELMFPRPTFAGEEMEVEVAVTGRQGGTIDLSREIRNRAGAPTCVGVAVVREGGT